MNELYVTMDSGWWRCVNVGSVIVTNVPSGGEMLIMGGYACVRAGIYGKSLHFPLNCAVNWNCFNKVLIKNKQKKCAAILGRGRLPGAADRAAWTALGSLCFPTWDKIGHGNIARFHIKENGDPFFRKVHLCCPWGNWGSVIHAHPLATAFVIFYRTGFFLT